MALIHDKETGVFVKSHDMSMTAVYGIWGNMLYRCNTETCPLYKNYGGRGINVVDRWLSFDNFISDMGDRPSKKHSIDRIDNDGDYSLSNCRWATKKEQSRNRRNSAYIYVDGLKLQVDDYCDKYNVRASTIKNRIRRKWTNDRIINTPVRRYPC